MHLQCKLFNTPIKYIESLVCIYARGPHILVTLRGPPLFPIPSPSSKLLVKSFPQNCFGKGGQRTTLLGTALWKEILTFSLRRKRKGANRIYFDTVVPCIFTVNLSEPFSIMKACIENVLLICTLNAAVIKVFKVYCLHMHVCTNKIQVCSICGQVYFEMFVDELSINVSCCMN